MTTDKRTLRQLTTLATFNKAASRLFIGIPVAISKLMQLNAAPYLGGVHSISLAHYTMGRDHAMANLAVR